MFRYGRGRICTVAAALIFAAACSGTPTGPSPTASSPTGSPTQESGGGAANTQAVVGATRFLAFGDSITFGTPSSFDEIPEDVVAASTCTVDTPPSDAYPNRLRSVLANSSPTQVFTITNCGVGGEAAFSGVQRLSSLLAAIKPQGLLLLEGINDLNVGRSIGETVGHLQTMIDIARVHNVTVFIATMFQTFESEDPNTGRVRHNSEELIRPFNDAIIRMAQGQQNVYIVDVYGRFGSGSGLLGNDGLHPTPAGYEQMAAAFGVRIGEAFAVRAGFQ